jgi:hypothetical protein
MTDTTPFDLPSDTLDQAVSKAEALLKYWRGPGAKPWRDELDAAYTVACSPGGARWGSGLRWRQLIAAVEGQPVPTK